jgi:hypothetical protein
MRELGLEGAEFAALATEILDRGKKLHFRARGVSMGPFIRHGDVVEIQAVDPARVRHGDVILFQDREGHVFAHRVLRLVRADEREVLITKGDALAQCDGPVSTGQLLGRVMAVERGRRRIRLDRFPLRFLGLLWTGLWRHFGLLLGAALGLHYQARSQSVSEWDDRRTVSGSVQD